MSKTTDTSKTGVGHAAGTPVAIHVGINGGGSTITTGIVAGADYVVPYNMQIDSWQIFANASGSVVVDVWADTYSNFPPTVLDSIAGAEKPTLSSASKNQDTSVGPWLLNEGDIMRFNVDSVTTVTSVNIILKGVRT